MRIVVFGHGIRDSVRESGGYRSFAAGKFEGGDTVFKRHVTVRSVNRFVAERNGELELPVAGVSVDGLLHLEVAVCVSGIRKRRLRDRGFADPSGIACLDRKRIAVSRVVVFGYHICETVRQILDNYALASLEADGRLAVDEFDAAVGAAERIIAERDREDEILLRIHVVSFEDFLNLEIAERVALVGNFNNRKGLKRDDANAAVNCSNVAVSRVIVFGNRVLYPDKQIRNNDSFVGSDFEDCRSVADGTRFDGNAVGVVSRVEAVVKKRLVVFVCKSYVYFELFFRILVRGSGNALLDNEVCVLRRGNLCGDFGKRKHHVARRTRMSSLCIEESKSVLSVN